MEHILYAVRCQYLTPNFLKEQMKNCDVLKKLPACREYLAKIFQVSQLLLIINWFLSVCLPIKPIINLQDLTLHKKPCVKERTPNTTRIIYIAGGYYKHSLDILEGYNIDDKTWVQLANLRLPRSGLGGAFLKVPYFYVPAWQWLLLVAKINLFAHVSG